MIEEQGRVLSLEPDAAWVETIRRNTCGSCQARAGCGQALLQRLGAGARQGYIRVLRDRSLQVGDQVVIGLPENAIVHASLCMYLVPLIGLFGAAFLAEGLGLAEPWVILAALTGLVSGFFGVRWYAWRQRSNPDMQPRILRIMPPNGIASSDTPLAMR
ncbi:SoxR reducing system RseC family protein [Halopseudomonas pelagia]|uniref:SoxR reducing system RseC family protein n=1 Tax=Halopseudomonas pelagia TaxID=553151 RepID=UPI00039A272A|nr:SoxR reducing system RseC family protein [Halopseudomonas pelagia]